METAVWSLVGVLLGGIITWYASRHFYMKAGKELREEASKLRKETEQVKQVAHAILGAQLNPNAELRPALDSEGNVTGIIVGAVGKA
jgi:gas vesicle protein